MRHQRCDGRHIDNRAPTLRAHDGQNVFADQKRAAQMNTQHAVPALQRPGFDRAEIGMPGGVEDAIDTSHLCMDRGYGVAHAVLAGDIHGQADRPRQFGGNGCGAGPVEVQNSHTPAFACKAPRDRRCQT